YALGLALGANGDLDSAGNEYSKALTLQPDLEEVHSNLRNVLREDPDPERTIADHGDAPPLVTQFAAAHNNLGIALSQKGDVIQAIAVFHEALRWNPNLGAAHNDLGTMRYISRTL